LADGRLRSSDREQLTDLRAADLLIAVDAETGWEAAVFDHFQALVSAISAKVQGAGPRSSQGDTIGGTTLTFDISAEHPLQAEVLGLLARVRGDLNAVWQRVCAHNADHPLSDDERIRVRFYFGQNVTDSDTTVSKPPGDS
jgi:hypothetical protein